MKVQLLFLEHILCPILTCTFIRATRGGLYEVHLSSLDEMWKYFFAQVKQKYASSSLSCRNGGNWNL